MLFYEVQLCVQQPSSCCSNVLCCSGNLREARGMKDTVSVFHLPFYSWDILVCWTEQGATTDLAVHQTCQWSGGPELLLCLGFLQLHLRKSAAWKMDVSGVCTSIVKFAVKGAKWWIFHAF